MRHYDKRQLEKLFAGREWPDRFTAHPNASKLDMRFVDTIDHTDDVYVLMPEVFCNLQDGNEIYARVISQCINYGWRTGCILYDLIPLNNSAYYRPDKAFSRYIAETLRLDDVFCISNHTRRELISLYNKFGLTEPWLNECGQCIHTIPLPSVAITSVLSTVDHKTPLDCIIMVGTVEIRKRQIEVVRAFTQLEIGRRSGLKLKIFGGLHPAIAQDFRDVVADNPYVEYLGYSTDEQVAAAYSHSLFSIFASDDEGFGLPITESLAHGVPCLTANFGAMAEAAEGGGCLTVDVRDDQALKQGLESMTFDDALELKLRAQLASRKSRTWDDYAREFWDALYGDQIASSSLMRASSLLDKSLRKNEPRVDLEIDLGEGGRSRVVNLELLYTSDAYRPSASEDESRGGIRVAFAIGDVEGWADLGSDSIAALTFFDAVLFETSSTHDAVLKAAASYQLARMLPGWFCLLRQGSGSSDVISKLQEILRQIRRCEIVAAREGNMHVASRYHQSGGSKPALSILISTYNRSLFIEMNVDWILKATASYKDVLELIVVDNASTDDTQQRLIPYLGNPQFRYIRNVQNVGMLGNWHICSTLMRARHVWIIGDDDFIVPGVIDLFLDMLVKDNTIPLIFMNFGVYNRDVIRMGDSPDLFLSEMMPLSVEPVKSGRRRITEIGLQHDNLFTAIYAMIFRSDIFAAIFNYPFTGKPFRSLVESVPTSKALLSVYPDVICEWVSVCGLAGNAHNSWQHHRVAWHGVLMPLVFELARQAGLDPELLQQWAMLHSRLLDEALQLFPDLTVTTDFSTDDLSVGRRVLGSRLMDSSNQTVSSIPAIVPRKHRKTRMNQRRT